jgi:hypothetical protein
MDRGRAALLPLPDGQADPEFLRLPVGALRSASTTAGRMSASTSTTIRATNTTWTAWTRASRNRSTTTPSTSALPAQAGAHRRVPALRGARAIVPEHHTVSESIGFIAKVNDKNPKDIDYPFYVTAHEVAHQWWGHQLVGGNTRGASVLSETLAEYSALMVMKKSFGAGKMRRFLRYDLDQYLMGRALERKKELPLAENETRTTSTTARAAWRCTSCRTCWARTRSTPCCTRCWRKHARRRRPIRSGRAGGRRCAPHAADQAYLIDDLFNPSCCMRTAPYRASARAAPTPQIRSDIQGQRRARCAPPTRAKKGGGAEGLDRHRRRRQGRQQPAARAQAHRAQGPDGTR